MILPLCNVDHISCVYVVPSTLMTFISKVINVKNKMKHNDVLSSDLKSCINFIRYIYTRKINHSMAEFNIALIQFNNKCNTRTSFRQ